MPGLGALQTDVRAWQRIWVGDQGEIPVLTLRTLVEAVKCRNQLNYGLAIPNFSSID